MRALQIPHHGGPEVLRFCEVDDPRPGPGEVSVAVRAIGLNHLDLWVRRGVPGHVFPLPLIPGSDGSGVVVELGAGVLGVAVGDRVAISPGLVPFATEESLSGAHALSRGFEILGETRNGTCAERVVLPAENLLPMPAGMGFEEAAAIPLAALTAHHMLVHRAALRAGQDVLIWAAGSGVSVYAIQIARLLGARVFTISTNPQKLDKALDLGAHEVISASKEDVLKRVKALTDQRGVDVVVDHVGAPTIGISLRCLARGGAVVTCGATGGPKLEADLRLIFFKSLSILGSTMGGMGEMRGLWRLVQRGQVRPVIDRILPFSRAQEAHEALESRSAFGKIVLRMDGPA